MRKTLILVITLLILLVLISVPVEPEGLRLSSAPDIDVVKNQMILESARISDMGMESARNMLLLAFFQNVTEADVVSAIEDCMTENGSSEFVEAFGIIVASGEQSALPHGDSSDDANNLILPGEVVVVDLGARYMGYCSDLTRTFFMGNATSEMMSIYNITLEAQEAGIQAVQSGAMARDVDAAARDIISGYGYGDNFTHGLGHGLGLYIHMPPTLSPSSNEVLFESGDLTVTIEPGIYLEGRFGVRIEDDVFVERSGQELLTRFPKDLEGAILIPKEGFNQSSGSEYNKDKEVQGASLFILPGLIFLLVLFVVIYIKFIKPRRYRARI